MAQKRKIGPAVWVFLLILIAVLAIGIVLVTQEFRSSEDIAGTSLNNRALTEIATLSR